MLGLLGSILAGPRGKALMEVKHGEEAGLWWRQRWGARIRALAQGPGLSLMEEVPVVGKDSVIAELSPRPRSPPGIIA